MALASPCRFGCDSERRACVRTSQERARVHRNRGKRLWLVGVPVEHWLRPCEV
jgi:hypothetical protein